MCQNCACVKGEHVRGSEHVNEGVHEAVRVHVCEGHLCSPSAEKALTLDE